MKHTPGPWTFYGHRIQGAGARQVATWHVEYIRYGEPARSTVRKEDDANARLIIAAPYLLDACKLAVKELFDDEQSSPGETLAFLALRHAIAKVEGE